jgi:hypothetical protein
MAISPDSDLEKRNQRLREAKMAVLGMSAAGIAHELGNALQSCEYNIQKLEARLTSDGEEILEIENLKKSAKFIGHVLRGMTSYSSNKLCLTEGVSVNVTVDSALDLLKSYIKHSQVKIHKSYSEDIPPVKADANRVLQIVVNLLRSAVQSMTESPVKNLTVTTSFRPRFVEVRIRDTGLGAPPKADTELLALLENNPYPENAAGLEFAVAKASAQESGIALDVVPLEIDGFEVVVSIPCSATFPLSRSRVLIVAEHYPNLESTIENIRAAGCEPFVAKKSEALKLLDLQPVDWVVCEQHMYPLSGVRFAQTYLRGMPLSIVILGESSSVPEDESDGRVIFLPKNVNAGTWRALLSEG